MSSVEGQLPQTPTQHRSRWRPPETGGNRLALCLALVLSLVLGFAFSTSEPNATGFFFDERIPLENVASILDGGGFRPRNYWYQSLSHLPQAGLLAVCEQVAEWTGSESLRIRDDDGFRPLAYRLCRATTLIFGGLSVWLTFVVGRRLFSDSAGVLAAWLLAVLPWHLFTSARFKPDGLLLMLTLLTFVWILEVVERPTLGNFARAGLGIGLAVATKLNGFVIAVPLALAALVDARRRPGRLLGLGLAAVTAVAVYVALNPWVGQTVATLGQNREYYSLAAEREGSGHVDVLLHSLASLVEPQFHGWLIGLAVVAGVLLVVAAPGRVGTTAPSKAGRARMQALLLLSFPVAQIVINAAATERFKENHLVQIAPFTCILAAQALVELVRWPSRLDPRRAGLATVAAVVVAGIVATASYRGVDAVYRSLVPTTFEAAIRTLAERDSKVPSPVVCVEGQPSRSDHQLARNLGFVVTVLGPWEAAEAPRLTGCDALVFGVDRLLATKDSPLSEIFAATAEPQRLRIEGSWLKRRGDDLVVLIADWRPVGERRPLPTTPTSSPSGHTVITELPGCNVSEQARSLELRVPVGNLKDAWPEEIAGALGDLRWHHLGKRRPGHLLGSERIPCQGEPLTIEISIAGTPPAGSELGLWVRSWRRDSAE